MTQSLDWSKSELTGVKMHKLRSNLGQLSYDLLKGQNVCPVAAEIRIGRSWLYLALFKGILNKMILNMRYLFIFCSCCITPAWMFRGVFWHVTDMHHDIYYDETKSPSDVCVSAMGRGTLDPGPYGDYRYINVILNISCDCLRAENVLLFITWIFFFFVLSMRTLNCSSEIFPKETAAIKIMPCGVFIDVTHPGNW